MFKKLNFKKNTTYKDKQNSSSGVDFSGKDKVIFKLFNPKSDLHTHYTRK